MLMRSAFYQLHKLQISSPDVTRGLYVHMTSRISWSTAGYHTTAIGSQTQTHFMAAEY